MGNFYCAYLKGAWKRNKSDELKNSRIEMVFDSFSIKRVGHLILVTAG